MNYLIQNYDINDRQLLGSENTTFVHDAKSMVKVNNALLRHTKTKDTTEVRVYSYSNLYDEKTYRLIKII